MKIKFNLLYPFIFYFFYSLFAGVFVQFIFLPVIFPSMHWYDGLIDYGDWVYFHEYGKKYAELIDQNGWGSWQLKPKNWGILGFISAIYSFTNIYKPYILIPFISLINALGGISLFLIIKKIFKSNTISFYSTLPFLLVPSSYLWVTQIMKDVFTINGILMFLCACFYFFNVTIYSKNINKKSLYSHLSLIFFFIFISTFFFYLIRPYIFYVSLVYFILLFLVIIFMFLLKLKTKDFKGINFTIFLITTVIIFVNYFILAYSLQYHNSKDSIKELVSMDEIVNEKIQLIIDKKNDLKDKKTASLNTEQNIVIKDKTELKDERTTLKINNKQNLNIKDIKEKCQDYQTIEKKDGNFEQFSISKTKYKEWEYTSFIPSQIDELIANMYKKRLYFILYQGCSNTKIDYDRDLNSFFKIIKYIPRALVVTFFSPFPQDWFNSKNLTHSFFYDLLSFEMIFHYLFILTFLLSLIFFYKNINFYFLLLSSIYFSSYSLFFFPNLGALVRYRHSGLILLSCLGLAVFLSVYKKKYKSINDK